MACSLVFSQSRVDFLDAFDERESSVPGTISMLFSILSACLCAWVVSESMTMRSVSCFSCFSLFFILMFLGKDKHGLLPSFSEFDQKIDLSCFSQKFVRKTQKEERKFNNDISNLLEGHHRPVSEKHTLSNCENYSWSISKSAYALRKTSDETSSSYSSFKQQNFPIPLLRL